MTGPLAGLVAALQFLTRLPIPDGLGRRADYGRALGWYPVVGLLLGTLLVGLDAAVAQVLSPLVRGVLVVGALALLTGALHLDGLADSCDALFAHATPERRLEILRDPRSGAFAVVGVAIVLLAKSAAVAETPWPIRGPSLVLAPAFGRLAIVFLASLFPYGRSEGLGLALKRATGRWTLLAGAVTCSAAAYLLAGLTGLALGAAALAIAWAMGAWQARRLPGLTGDSYGATCEVVETAFLVLAVPVFNVLGWP